MKLFDYFSQEHGLALTPEEELDIIALVMALPCEGKRCDEFDEIGRSLCNTCLDRKGGGDENSADKPTAPEFFGMDGPGYGGSWDIHLNRDKSTLYSNMNTSYYSQE